MLKPIEQRMLLAWLESFGASYRPVVVKAGVMGISTEVSALDYTIAARVREVWGGPPLVDLHAKRERWDLYEHVGSIRGGVWVPSRESARMRRAKADRERAACIDADVKRISRIALAVLEQVRGEDVVENWTRLEPAIGGAVG